MQSASKMCTKKQVADAADSIFNLFWYPKLEDGILLKNNPLLQSDFDKKYGKNTPSRTNDVDLFMYVVAEHIYAVLNCYPGVHPDSQKQLINSFCSNVIRDWELTYLGSEIKNVINQMYFLDEQQSIASSESGSESCSYSEGSDESEELEGGEDKSSEFQIVSGMMAVFIDRVGNAANHLLHRKVKDQALPSILVVQGEVSHSVSSGGMVGSTHASVKVDHQDKKQKMTDKNYVSDSSGLVSKWLIRG